MAEIIKHLKLYETEIIFPLVSRSPITDTVRIVSAGNSILSSVFILAADAGATLDVKWFETTTGDTNVGERKDLDSHRQFTVADVGLTDSILVTKLHNKPNCEITIAGGNVTFGVYVTIVASFASDLDSALHLDADVGNLLVDKGIPIMCYDEDENKFRLIRCKDGKLDVGVNLNNPTTPKIYNVLTSATPNTEASQVLTSNTKKFTIRCRGLATTKLAFTATESGTNFITIPRGTTASWEGIDYSGTLYFQVNKASQIIEIVEWT